jgi:putative endonuclease
LPDDQRQPYERHVRGRAAEQLVVEYLEGLGYEILGTNVRIGHLELDVVARDGAVIVVVEVRTRGRGAWTTAFESFSSEKRKRVRRAGERLWRMQFRRDRSAERMRFDAAAVTFDDDGPRIEYVRAAF